MRIAEVTALVLATLAVAPAAQAVVVTSAAANIVVPATTAGIYINVVSGASGTAAATPGWDINPWSSTALNFFNPTPVPAGGTYVTTSGAVVAALSFGAVVGPASTYNGTANGTTTFGAGAWQLNATNYFGFQFTGDDGLLHYGYGTVIVGATPTVRSIGNLFYESVANTPITVVPEASTWAMMLVGGAAVAGAIRRRRQA